MRILVAVCAGWVACELVLLFAKRSRAADVTRRDQGSVWVLWLVFTVCAFLGGMLSSVRETRFPPAARPYAIWVGIALIILGFVIRVAAILTLRRYFTVDVAIAKDHKVIDTGLYRTVRHPSYFGSFLSFLGLGLAFLNWLSLALINALGDEYRAYAARTKRFIPGVF